MWLNGLRIISCSEGLGDGYAHLDAGGNNAEGKAIWVIKGADCVVEGIEFSGCQVPDHNSTAHPAGGQKPDAAELLFSPQ